jgi:hypothetical protein
LTYVLYMCVCLYTYVYDMKTIDQILNEQARLMAKDIEDQLLMTKMGWHKLELSQGTVYDALYLTVHPDNGSHWNEMMQWMIDSFGPTAQDGVWTANQRWYANNARFWFRDSRDLTLFILRWS